LLNYTRHFILLLAAAAALAAAGRIIAVLAPGGFPSAAAIATEFTIYGAVHAIALVRSLKAQRSLERRIAFVAVAAALSLSTACLSLSLLRRALGPGSALPILTAAAALGALAYAGAIRGMLEHRLALRTAVLMSAACAAAVAAAYSLVRHFPSALGLAIPWWLAFSGALWLRDARPAPP
jgi:protein-S-isoprenylcysteine O-methyltransferase Ste14